MTNSDRIDQLYLKLLSFALNRVRDAAWDDDFERCGVEADFIHNIPSLIGEENRKRHIYHAVEERNRFLQWAQSVRRDDVSRDIVLFYNPIWEEMDKLIGIDDEVDNAK